MFLIFDTETTGLPRDWNAPITDSDNWPRMVQIAWQLHDAEGRLIEVKNFIVKPEGYDIPFNAQKIHGISTERAHKQGVELSFVLEEFNKALQQTEFVVGHNIEFDINIIGAEFHRKQKATELLHQKTIDTKDESTDYCAIPGGKGGKFKWPTLTELHEKLFGERFEEAHNAAADVEATARCFLELVRIGVIGPQRLGKDEAFVRQFREQNPDTIQLLGLNIEPYRPEDLVPETETDETPVKHSEHHQGDIDVKPYVHLHVHSQFSVLQAVGNPADYVKKAAKMGMEAVAMTDQGNMMGAFSFVQQAKKAGIKAIVGSEINVCKNRHDKSKKDNGYQQVFLAKNKSGYHNLAKLSSISFTEGFYYVPRIDKDVLIEYRENLIATTGGLFAEIPSLILNVGEQQAEEAFRWWHEQFGDDFYIELSRHGLEEEEVVNKTLLRFAEKYGVKYFASNNVYYPGKKDAAAHDLLLCVRDNQLVETPKKLMGKRGREFRFGFPNDEWYFKSAEEMSRLFADLPEALETTIEIAGKCEPYDLASEVLLPKFEIPEEFIDPKDEEDGGKRGENAYLRHLTYEGAKKRYGNLSDELRERLDFELETIANTGYPGYFLIVQDFTNKAREMGVWVGPGRGSAAGSAVAYCIGITNVDPIKYDLLFERFLNPDRVSMPDIDIDFDDEGRQKVIDYVIEKYGASQVAQIITYGTMAAKSSVRDTARVLNLPLDDANRIASLIPLNVSLTDIISEDKEVREKLKSKLRDDDLRKVEEIRKIYKAAGDRAKTIEQATALEGSLRNTGVHACGVIITPSDITNHIPVATAKDSDMVVTQFDNSVVESAGLLKMDFLGLKTLSILKDAVALVEKRHGIKIDIDEIPLDDQKTYELFQRGDTKGLFQFESAGMRKYLMELKPDKFEDLIAMNALYRPGPLEYIPNFIARKHGREAISYDLEGMEEFLAETYGITVYQEQVMLLSQKLAGFSKGQADALRKAMGKKKRDIIDKMKPEFLEGCKKRGYDLEKAEKVWKDWEAFAAYAFNKSHSTCYSVIAFQTAYLKAHYPAEYMASVLTHNLSDITKITDFMEECRRIGVKVLGPDINESEMKFSVNAKGEVRFGLAAMKGIGESAVSSIIEEREKNGPFASIFDFIQRINQKSVNKKAIEALALGGAFDAFKIEREQFFAIDRFGRPFIETLVKYGTQYTEAKNSTQISLFGGSSEMSMSTPPFPEAEPWPLLQKLKKEREVVGIFISGHPLDQYRLDIDTYCNVDVQTVESEKERLIDRTLNFAGIITDVQHRTSKAGNPWGEILVEDYSGSTKIRFFSSDYAKFKGYFIPDTFVFITARYVKKVFNNGEGRIQLNVQNMMFLGEVRDKFTKWLKLEIDVKQTGNGLSGVIEKLFKKHKGSTKVMMSFIDREQGIKVDSIAREVAISPANELLEALDRLPEVTYTLSQKL